MSMPINVLITEHKLILQTIELATKESDKLHAGKVVNPTFISSAVDFFRTYADRFHHGKEEGILFKDLQQKLLNQKDLKVMNELIEEHVFARRTVTALENAKEKYVSGDKEALKKVLEMLDTLVKLYPAHIDKENNHFFFPSMQYFSEQERKQMLDNFLAFNQDFTDKRYRQIITSLE